MGKAYQYGCKDSKDSTSYALRDKDDKLGVEVCKRTQSKPELLASRTGDQVCTNSKTASISQFLSNDMSLSLTPSLNNDSKVTRNDKEFSKKQGVVDAAGQGFEVTANAYWKGKHNQTFFGGGFKNNIEFQKKK